MRSGPDPERAARQAGMTLVELMVALTISLLLMLGLTMLFASTSLSFRVNDEVARLQENGSAALRYLVGDIRNAGFYGIGTSTRSIDRNSISGIVIDPDCGAPLGTIAWALDLGLPLSIIQDLTPAQANTNFPCIAAENFYPGSPVIVVRGANGTAISAAPGGSIATALRAQPNYRDTLYVQGSTQDPNTVLFFGEAYANPRSAGGNRVLKDGTEAPAFEYQTHVYYIRPCSRPSVSGLCQTGDDNGAPIPTLVRQELSGSKLQEVALVEGIEALGLSYGVDSDGDGIPDLYTSATPGNWGQVTALRISVRVRSSAPVAGHKDSGKSYDLGNGKAPFSCAAAADCRYMRQVYAQSAQLRNCVLRRQGGGTC